MEREMPKEWTTSDDRVETISVYNRVPGRNATRRNTIR
jgi:hypothetical protein